METVGKLREELEFIEGVLTDLKKEIKKDGAIVNLKQGEQKMRVESAAAKTYYSYNLRLQQLLKLLDDLTPEQVEKDEFESF